MTDFQELLDQVCASPAVFVGEPRLDLVRAFLDGYAVSMRDYPFADLMVWLEHKYYIFSSAWGWSRILHRVYGSDAEAIKALPVEYRESQAAPSFERRSDTVDLASVPDDLLQFILNTRIEDGWVYVPDDAPPIKPLLSLRETREDPEGARATNARLMTDLGELLLAKARKSDWNESGWADLAEIADYLSEPDRAAAYRERAERASRVFDDHMGRLVAHLETIPATWEALLARGVTERTELRLEFAYTARTKSAADGLKRWLDGFDYTAEIRKTGPLLRRQWTVEGSTRPQPLTPERLDTWISHMMDAEREHPCTFDRWTAHR